MPEDRPLERLEEPEGIVEATVQVLPIPTRGCVA